MGWKNIFSFTKSQAKKVNAEELAIQSGFTEEVIIVIKRIAKTDLRSFYSKDLYSEGAAKAIGLFFNTKEETAEGQLYKLQTELKPLGALAFITERENKKASVAIVMGNDQFDILKIQQTNGENYDISNNDVVVKLKEWHKRYCFTIIGADYDWVEVDFSEFPTSNDLRPFAKELYEFCPDIVDQGTGSIDGFIEELKEYRRLVLWWD
ncbi:DUF4253 domain-containing protein [Heyndrickxia sp. MSNUG]|uniref:DUF4253 domain-containing protein n=1 Tax=Heyndrickxia sp. MSNUG TaxID=3136677 RepID=UPI003C2E46C3